ncbi:hypothetical protein H6G76_32465 [Nostoc sp. FACHB-152]|uniref:hypothetical protein n=1 Tax=unclassified Nostoc TaxID=2593658 RepID=UPI00168288AB|nr:MULTISPECIES: hypothetical protein [unclassified Nostoc]MBD2451753.1 hypothetical protein [Nostoc sp. FACHB-152]MBD2472864.1 hypothetical protein [Nostoc sp. FACHB-145]
MIFHQTRRSLLKPIIQFILTSLLVCWFVVFGSGVNAITTGYLTEQGELFRQALAAAKLTPDDLKIDQADMALWGGDKYRFKMLDLFFENPWKISSYTRTSSKDLLAAKSNLAFLAFNAHRRINAGANPSLSQDLLTKYQQQVKKQGDDALAVSLSQLTGNSADSFKNKQYQALPSQLRAEVAQFLLAIPDVLRYRELGLLRSLNKLQLDADTTYTDVIGYIMQTVNQDAAQAKKETPEQVLLIESLLDNVDFKLLNTGAILAISATQNLQNQLSQLNLSSLLGDEEYTVDTPQGKIIINGKGDRVYPPGDYLLIVDVAGNDTYSGGAATRNISHGVSVIIDLAGNDKYSSPPGTVPSFGAGVFGYGMLMDMQGNDTYEAEYFSQGIGIFGTGILYDAQGQDSYQGIGNLQGSGSFGTGMLIDNSGSDRYSLYRYGQGYGFTKGVGLLLDAEGDDHYIGMEDKYPNGGPFGTDKHVHFAQGAAYGRRADQSDGHSWAGGIGMLIDGTGNDRYECDVYCQGTGYWYSLGMFVDKSGDDYHRSGVYSLGGSPHFAIGIYQDDSGSDRYNVRISQSLGQGRDWSIGWFEDSAGNDQYLGHHGILGSADVNGIGVFWDKKGDDTYLSFAEPAYGQSFVESPSGLRELMFSLGLFVDGGGKDKYLLVPEKYNQTKLEELDINPKNFVTNPVAGNNRVWCRPSIPRNVKRAYGCGIDAE